MPGSELAAGKFFVVSTVQEAVQPVAPQLLNCLTSPTGPSLEELITPRSTPKLALQALLGFQYP